MLSSDATVCYYNGRVLDDESDPRLRDCEYLEVEFAVKPSVVHQNEMKLDMMWTNF